MSERVRRHTAHSYLKHENNILRISTQPAAATDGVNTVHDSANMSSLRQSQHKNTTETRSGW